MLDHINVDTPKRPVIIKDWAAFLVKISQKNLEEIVRLSDEEIFERNSKLVTTYLTEWNIIGKMKKVLDKLVENCRMCEKKVKVPNLIEHSHYCEQYFQIKNKLNGLAKDFIAKYKIFETCILKREAKSNIGSM